MPDHLIITIASTGFGIAFLHAALPTHWLPFALTARAKRWNGIKTLAITLSAATAHVLFTILLGGLIFWGGMELSQEIHELFHWVAGGILILLGSWFILRQIQGKEHGHTRLLGKHGEEIHDHDYDDHCIDRELSERKGNALSIGSLIMMLTLSPCESFLPIYMSGSAYGWEGFLILSVALLIATVGSMTLFTMLARYGIERLPLGPLERYENGLLGILLVILGSVFFVWGH
ncbi:MAG: hypothetical protein J4G05_00895 [Chlorobi bacterium]|nr:hypothetical protein [Chlorobiota bacterium]